MDDFLNAIWSLTPTVMIGLIFWLVIRGILRADRTERDSYAAIEAEERAKRAAAREGEAASESAAH